ncbi:MAG: N-acetyl-gamma-glutamyl-phosphate reductase [Erysipelotrichaceae bacterium]|nr:N-acetyl-gamma-glutamyl-phosphate reductase [Erysipelotrichaceae bacterium]
MIKVGIIGASGYAGIELYRLLLGHDEVEIVAVSSQSYIGQSISDLYPAFYGYDDRFFESDEAVLHKAEMIFASLPAGISEKYAKLCDEHGKKFIDLGADFRLDNEADYKEWYGKDYSEKELHKKQVYGLSEVNRDKIKNATIIGNPGCYPTSITLGLYPLLSEHLNLNNDIVIDSKSGTTGAGKTLTEDSHFPRCNESFHPYKIGNHRHTPEIEQELSKTAHEDIHVTFVPHLLPINRGIVSTMYVKLKEDVTFDDVMSAYHKYYDDEYFIRVLNGKVADLKFVKYSNYCDISLHYEPRYHQVIVVSAIDNMVKGAAGQAIQNMNIMYGIEETKGIKMAAPSF